MGFLLFWAGSILVSVFVEVTTVMKVFKTACEEGFKVDIHHSKEFIDGLVPENNKKNSLNNLLIPGFNLIYSFSFSMSCVQSLDQIIDQFHAMDSLPRMTKEEQQRFEEKPTLMTALLITCDFVYQELEEEQLKQDLEDADYIVIDNDHEKSEYYFLVTDDKKDIRIVKTEGDASKLSEEEQKENALNYFVLLHHNHEQEFEDREEINKQLAEKGWVEVEANSISNPDLLDLSNEEKIQIYLDYKEEFFTDEEEPKVYKKER